MLLLEALSRDRIWGRLFDKIDTRFPRMDHDDLLVAGVDTNTSMGMVDVEHEQCHSAVGRFSPLQCFCDSFRLLSQHNRYACCNNILQEAAVVQPGSTHNQSYRTGCFTDAGVSNCFFDSDHRVVKGKLRVIKCLKKQASSLRRFESSVFEKYQNDNMGV